MIPYTEPELNKKAFNCPHCNAFANQQWQEVGGIQVNGNAVNVLLRDTGARIARCTHCSQVSIWVQGSMVYPNKTIAPLPNQDMPQIIKDDFEEARQIVSYSPRGAAALLRLAVQKLWIHLGEPGENINADIASLVKKGLPERLQKALDSVRVIGNNAVHPGKIDLNDDVELTYKLFHFINLIVEAMITQPRMIDDVYNLKLPEAARTAIEKRDGK
jgi:hypothetical protein